MKGISDAGALVASLPLRNIIQVVADGLDIILGAPRSRKPTVIMRIPVATAGMFKDTRRRRPRPFKQPGNFGVCRPVLAAVDAGRSGTQWKGMRR